MTFCGTAYKGGDDIWPDYATVEDLGGLPPHVISLNECDPIRDEGKEYFQKLSRAGVLVTGRMTLGTVHMGEYMTESYPECTRPYAQRNPGVHVLRLQVSCCYAW